HCRCVLQHLPDPLHGLQRLLDAVRPGGWLLVEEIDVGSFRAADGAHPRAPGFDRRTRALWAAVRSSGPIDPAFGRRLPALVEDCRVRDLGHDRVSLTGRGGGLIARFSRMTDKLLRDRFVSNGVLTELDFDEREWAFDDPSFWFVGFTFFGAWGRRFD